MARGAPAGTKNTAQELGLEGGLLCQLVHSPDYRLFPNSAVFESNFIQVTKKGKFVDITNAPTIVTMGVTSSDPCLPLPNVLLMARCRTSPQRDPGEVSNHPSIALTRLLPLRYIRLSVHNAAQRILRILTVTKKVYYLQLHPEHPQAVFALWGRLADILQKGLSITTKDPNIRIRHSLVPSGSSPSSSSSSAEHSEPGASQQSSSMKKVGRKMPGVFSHITAKPPRKGKGQRKAPFEGDIRKTVSALSNEIRVLFCDMPPPLVCAKCKGRLPPEVAMRSGGEPGPSESDLDLLRWVDGSSYGLWQQEAPSWLQPLCRLSSLAAAGWK